MLILTASASLLVLFAFWAFYPKIPGAYEGYGVGAGRRARAEALGGNSFLQEEKIFVGESQDYIVITGQMTLLDVEKATSLAAREIADVMGLPSKVSLEETLGRLRKKYPFTLEEVRETVTELLNKRNLITLEKKEEKGSQTIKQQGISEESQPKEFHQEEHKQELTRGRMAEDTSGILITGQMTFYDIELKSGISARTIAEELGLPANVPLNERLGRLRITQ